jgi:hypothetical protein
LQPEARLAVKPPGVSRFYHYITEHGVLPTECGVSDEAGAWQLKALCATRSFCLWLNKGIDALHYFNAYEPDARSFGLLPTNLKDLPAQASFAEVATPPMRAIQNLVHAFAGSVPLARTDPLAVEVVSLGPELKVFEGDPTHPPLWHREVLAVLPFQVNPERHVAIVYVMTRDCTKPFAPAAFRLTFGGVKGTRAEAVDVLSAAPVAMQAKAIEANKLEVTLLVTDTPIAISIAQ